MPVSILIVVDFPAPLGPRQPTISPRAMAKVSPSTARTSWERAVEQVAHGSEGAPAVAGDAEGLA